MSIFELVALLNAIAKLIIAVAIVISACRRSP